MRAHSSPANAARASKSSVRRCSPSPIRLYERIIGATITEHNERRHVGVPDLPPAFALYKTRAIKGGSIAGAVLIIAAIGGGIVLVPTCIIGSATSPDLDTIQQPINR